MFRFFAPSYHVRSVSELTPPRLAAMGLEALLVDADSTLKHYTSEECLPEAAAWLADLRAGGIGLCLISNGRQRRIERFAASIGLPFVAKAFKPLPHSCRNAVRKMGFQPARTAIVGDQLFADVLAGRLVGLATILVDPIHPEQEHWFTRLKRRPERWLVRRMTAAGLIRDLPDGEGPARE
jgi:HAD superfamily phosphatase (TIGR01668 family)